MVLGVSRALLPTEWLALDFRGRVVDQAALAGGKDLESKVAPSDVERVDQLRLVNVQVKAFSANHDHAVHFH